MRPHESGCSSPTRCAQHGSSMKGVRVRSANATMGSVASQGRYPSTHAQPSLAPSSKTNFSRRVRNDRPRRRSA